MDIKEYQSLVEFVEKELEIAPGVLFAEGYDDWQTRLRLARILTRNFQKYDKAIDLFLTAVDSKPTNIEQFEDIVWALRDLFVCIYYHEKDPEKALKYNNQAIQMTELDMTKKFTFFVRGELWCWRWVALKDLGNIQTALQEAQDKIRTFSAEDEKVVTDNSYVYYAYYFISNLAYSEQDHATALDTIKQALIYYPLKEKQGRVTEILSKPDLSDQERYEQILQITRQEAEWTML